MAGAAERGELGLERAHLGAEDELAVIDDARDRLVDARRQAAALGGEIDERNRRQARVLVHHPATRRGVLRGSTSADAIVEAPDRDFEAGDAFFAGHRRIAPVRIACTNADSSARSGSAWPTDRWRIE